MSIADPVKAALWDPYSRKREAQLELYNVIAYILVLTNSTINFLLYCFSGKMFRNEVKKLLCSCRNNNTAIEAPQ